MSDPSFEASKKLPPMKRPRAAPRHTLNLSLDVYMRVRRIAERRHWTLQQTIEELLTHYDDVRRKR